MEDVLQICWECLDGNTLRLPVPGGWIVRHQSTFSQPHKSSISRPISESMVYVPDIEHEWLKKDEISNDEELKLYV
jgi:hypothetical protein